MQGPAAHIVIMFIAMFGIQVFAMPYVMAARPTHVYFTPTQAYMGVFMGACMVAVEGVIHPMPWWVWAVSVFLAVASVVAYRLQIGISDRAWMREMIPHHSMALVTSAPRTRSSDPFVQRLAEKIIIAQEREIGEMQTQLATRSTH
jgi:hypothetical protein